MRFAILLSCLIPAAGWAQAPARPGPIYAEIPNAVLEDKIRGGLLGQILGDLNGLKHEMKYIGEPGAVETYTPELPEGAWTDDDTDVEWIYVLEMERSGTLLIPPPGIVELWKRHINRRFWCSNQYVRQLMDIGIEPPLTGSAALNPWAEFNLSGQFLSETWGLISPGMPLSAARMAVHYTRVGIDREPAQAAQMFSSMIATAFFTPDLERILDAGVAATDPASSMRRIVADVRRWHKANPGDWRATRKLIQERYSRFGGQDMRDRNGVELNGAATVAALLYGAGNFTETLRHAFNFGWDCDNNAATSGAIVGVIKGQRSMKEQGWNIQDRFKNTSRDNVPEDETITRFGDRLVRLAQRTIKESGGDAGPATCRIEVQRAAPVERLGRSEARIASMRLLLKPRIERGVRASKDPREQARSAYLAICLDLAPELREKAPDRWQAALAALKGYPNVLQVLFYESPIPAGDRLREKAVAAGLAKPEQRVKLW